MREFYRQIRTDCEKMCFFAVCPACGKRYLGASLPLICRDPRIPELVKNGRAGRIRQYAYLKKLAQTVPRLAKHFNFCRYCGNWICNTCFHAENADGICAACEKETTIRF